MVITVGVKMKGLCRQIKKVLRILETIFEESGNKLIVKGSRMGFDKARGAHESGRAIDIEWPTSMHTQTKTRISLSLGLNYIVRLHENHLHIEWSPMPPESIKVAHWAHQLLERSVKKC